MHRSIVLASMASLLMTANFARANAAAETDDTETQGGGAAPVVETPVTAEAAATTEKKSIVPPKYNDGRYKNGGNDPLAEFIKGIAYDKGELVESTFFELARKNIGGSLTEEKIAHYEAQCTDKRQGAAGRARMTIGNMLRSIARKQGFLLNLSGDKVEITGLAKPAVSGAAAKAQEAKPAETVQDPDGNGKPGDQTEADDATE